MLEVDAENRRPASDTNNSRRTPDVFETIFGVDSLHEGTVLKVGEKGATVALPYGVEGFCPNKHLVKEDGQSLKADAQSRLQGHRV